MSALMKASLLEAGAPSLPGGMLLGQTVCNNDTAKKSDPNTSGLQSVCGACTALVVGLVAMDVLLVLLGLLVTGGMQSQPANFTCQGSGGQAGFDRPNHDLPGWPVHQGSAAACEASCTVDVQCRMWSWSAADQQCWLKNLIGPRTAAPGFCSSLAPAPPASAAERFPLGNYTPFGYLQNGYHSSIHFSGILRTDDVLNGLGWFFPIKIPDDQPLGALGADDYVTLLAFSARPGGLERAPVLSNEAFADAGIERSSDLHTKSRLRVGWETPGILTSAEYWQMGEDMLAAEVTVRSTNSAGATNAANTAAVDVLLSVGRNAATEVRGSSGGSSELCVDPGGGTVFGLKLIGSSAATQVGGGFFENASVAAVGLQQPSTTITNASFPGSRGIGALTFTLPVASSRNSAILFLMARGASCAAVSAALSDGDLSTTMLQHRAYLKEEDGRFWTSAARVSGAWPAAWQSGLIYDFNNIRLNLQPAEGIFKDRWDGMQVGYPRVVVAESPIDYLTLSYDNMDLAKRLFFGLFRDAIAGNVPCVHENGQSNLVCVDGSVGGTPPCWGGLFITAFFTDPPGAIPVASDSNHTVPEWGHDRCWTVSGQFRPAHDAFRLDRVWAAITTVLLLQNVVGFREAHIETGDHPQAFDLVPQLPLQVFEQCTGFNAGHLMEFRVHNLAVRGRIFDLTYEHRCRSTAGEIDASGEVPLRVVLHEHERVEGSAGSIVSLMTEVLSFDTDNGRKCRVEIGVTGAAWKARCAN
eukprot:CAMPEP_0177246250 /NCGR_PEP_ID=MMETSP0367-20130122/50906_1 /TAXON_ID=447022 ORGANISM="Scrippsiella hangoei-like, Strain SHHI-4" /NCGR_SAMPLE_ID=MMETSP0367 /ASSEMBLY_ACC=CAM_ASM_000362 /LENGTH=753 /DNA_ID=CAMNT_0018698251 /DNA_START=54 /DNA_END=2314 /DNA_ORIENTATION=+